MGTTSGTRERVPSMPTASASTASSRQAEAKPLDLAAAEVLAEGELYDVALREQ